MQIGGTEAYTIDDLVFHVRIAWGPRRVLEDGWPELVMARTAAEGLVEKATVDQRIVAAFMDLLRQVVVRIDNLQAADGVPVVEWSDAIADELPAPVFQELCSRVRESLSDVRLERAKAEALAGEPGNAESGPPSSPVATTEEPA